MTSSHHLQNELLQNRGPAGIVNPMHEKLRQERSYRGQNRFIKSFVHNKKNSSLFNPFLGRYNMNNNSDDAARAERIRAKK